MIARNPAVAEQEPADRVAGAADNQRSETGVHRGCRPRRRARGARGGAPATRAAPRLRRQPWARRADAAVASARSSSGVVWAYSMPTRSSSARGPGQGRADI
jgi:hypothetical protein